jgi:beta-glucosidase
MRRPSPLVRVDGRPVTWLGANFWSRAGGPFMWRTYDGDVVREELRVLHEHGLDLTRSFFFWPDLMPTPDTLDEQKVAHYADFLDAHAEIGMRTIPTFVVGHMSGQNWDPSWRGDRDLYTDVWLVARTAWYVRELTSRFAAHPSVAGWLISNEMPIYGRPDPASADVLSWAELMVQAVRAGGGTQPVSLGDGAWGVETTGVPNGFPLRGVGPLVDFTGPHVYRMESDVVRQHLKAAFVCELAAVAGLPVVLEEFGLTSDFASDVNAGHYYRQVLHTSLLAGATGWIAWNNTDYDDLVDQPPYNHHPFEMHFGITDDRGRPKPPLLELRDFRRVLDALDLPRCRRWDADAALVVSSYLEAGYPFTQAEEPPFVLAGLEQAHIAAREAGLTLGFEREQDGIAGGYPLYLLPSTKQLTGPGWRRLGELAAAGATVYASYAAGASSAQRGPWWSRTEELFGVRHQLVYGLSDPIEDDEVELTFVRPFGDLAEGDRLTVHAAGGVSRAFLPVEVTDGELLATDARGRPALVAKRHGAGTMVLGTYPLEYLASARARVNPEDTWRLYRALGAHAGIRPPVTVEDPRVLVDGLVHDDGRRFVWFVSECAEPLTFAPQLRDGGTLVELAGGEVSKVELEPYGVRVLVQHNQVQHNQEEGS